MGKSCSRYGDEGGVRDGVKECAYVGVEVEVGGVSEKEQTVVVGSGCDYQLEAIMDQRG